MESNEQKSGHISLKEAAEISGYAPDYIGQLIRGGKLYGKQVYSNIAWVTTEEAIIEYMEKGARKGSHKSFFLDIRWMKIGRYVLLFIIVVVSALFVVLFYVSVALIEQANYRASVDTKIVDEMEVILNPIVID